MNVQNLNEEGPHTVLCGVEVMINSRPVAKAPADPSDLEALTPKHLLFLKSKPSMPPGDFDKTDIYARQGWKQVWYMSDLILEKVD